MSDPSAWPREPGPAPPSYDDPFGTGFDDHVDRRDPFSEPRRLDQASRLDQPTEPATSPVAAPVAAPVGASVGAPAPNGPGLGPAPSPPLTPASRWQALAPAGGPKPRPRWGLGDVAYGLLLMLALTVVFSIPLAYRDGDVDDVWVQVLGSLGVWLGLGGWSLYASWVKGYGTLKLDFSWAFRWYDPFLGMSVCMLTFVVAIVLGVIQRAVGVETATNAQFLEDARESSPGWVYLVFILLVGVGAPVVEELFFRGLTYSALLRRSGPVVAVIGSTLLFGLLHFQPGPFVPTLFLVLNITAFGLILGLTRYFTGRTGAGVFAHAWFNLTAALLIFFGAG